MTVAGTGMVDVTLPAEQSEGTEIVISTWFKSVGDQVTENEPLLEVSTDKVNVEIAAPTSGRLAEILKKDGDSVQPGEIVGRIALGDATVNAPQTEERPSTSQADGPTAPRARLPRRAAGCSSGRSSAGCPRPRSRRSRSSPISVRSAGRRSLVSAESRPTRSWQGSSSGG